MFFSEIKVSYLPQFIFAVLTEEAGLMVLLFVHYHSVHGISSPPTYRAQL